MRMLVVGIIFILASTVEAQESNNIILYKKGACMGKCPVYTISVKENGTLAYHGVMNVDMIGKFERQLSKKEFRKIKRKFKKAKLNKLEDEYGMNIMDAPMTTVKYSAKYSKSIKIKSEIPEKLVKAEEYLLSLVKNDNNLFTWAKIDQPNSEKKIEDSVLKGSGRKEMNRPNIIVQLNSNDDIEKWLTKYADYDLKLEKRLSPNRPLYLLMFDNSSIDALKLVEMLNNDDHMDTAELNKKVQMRDR